MSTLLEAGWKTARGSRSGAQGGPRRRAASWPLSQSPGAWPLAPLTCSSSTVHRPWPPKAPHSPPTLLVLLSQLPWRCLRPCRHGHPGERRPRPGSTSSSQQQSVGWRRTPTLSVPVAYLGSRATGAGHTGLSPGPSPSSVLLSPRWSVVWILPPADSAFNIQGPQDMHLVPGDPRPLLDVQEPQVTCLVASGLTRPPYLAGSALGPITAQPG